MIRQATLSIGALALITASGCSASWQSASKLATYTAPLSADTISQAESVSIETKAGDVLLEPAEHGPKVVGKIRARTQERANATTISAVINEGTLEITVNWPEGKRKKSESCDLLVYLPTMTGVSIDTSAGDIFVKEMAGNMDIQSSAGDIEVHDHDGSITARTSAGDIDFWDITGPVDVVSSAGDISLHRVGAPAQAKTSAGDVFVILHADATGTIKASTSAGDVSLAGTHFSAKSGSVVLTDEGPTSWFVTSAGDVEVTVGSR